MAIGIGDNFKYQGKKPNFTRDSIMDNGHISFCVATGETYRFDSENTSDTVTGKWRLFGMRMNIHNINLTESITIVSNELKTLEDVYYINVGDTVYTVDSDINVKWVDGKKPTPVQNSVLVISVLNNLAVWAVFK